MNAEVSKGGFVFEGIVFMILGVLAISLPALTSLSITMLLGFLFLVAGVVQLVRVFRYKGDSRFIVSLLLAVLPLLMGAYILMYPVHAVVILGTILAIWFLLHGIIEIILSIQFRAVNSNWSYMLFSGVISLVLALMIYSGWPGSAVWIIGLLFGINLLFFGVTLLLLSGGSK